ncbi:MAG: phosphoribosylformylglycinamidine (FGAM) synthase-like enzyme, partial [Bacteroidia bacterium]
GTPVTGGNVSFYNQSSDGTAVYPTPTIGMIGLVEKPEHITTLGFKNEGDVIYLLGKEIVDIGSSQYVSKYHKVEFSPCPHFNLDDEFDLQATVMQAIEEGRVKSCHDISEGGLFICLLESVMSSGLGIDIQTNKEERLDAYLFGESQSRIVVSIADDQTESFEAFLNTQDLHHRKLGTVSGNRLFINDNDFGSIDEYRDIYDNAIEKSLMS